MQDDGNSAEEDGGSSILVVEDEFLIAMDLEDILTRNGCRVIGPVATVGAALALLEKEAPQAAVLDVNLKGERVTPVAQALAARGIPFLLVTAYSGEELDDTPILGNAHRVAKPVSERRLMKMLEARTDGLIRRRDR